MPRLISLIRSFVCRIATMTDPDEAYLDAAIDIPELERRMRRLAMKG